MNVIKKEFGRLREASLRHFVIAFLAAGLMTAFAVTRLPLKAMDLSALCLIITVLEPLAVLFVFYSMVPAPEASVFRSVRCLYYFGVPFGLSMLSYAVFDPKNAEMYSESYVSRFLPKWAGLWWGGVILAYILMRTAEHALKTGSAKGSFAAKAAYDLAVMYTPQKTVSTEIRPGKKKWASFGVCLFMVAFAVFLLTVTLFLHVVYSNMEFEAILFTVTFAAGALALEDVIQAITLVIFFLLITGYIGLRLFKCFRNSSITVSDSGETGEYTLVMTGRKRALHIVLSAVMMISFAAAFSRQTNFLHYVKMKLDRSDIYEKHYTAPSETEITFPKKKRNLIYIYLESIENTYASKSAGGDLDRNYIPGLTALANESGSVNFSNTELLGGASVFVPAITYTQGSTVAQTSGIATLTQFSQFWKEPVYPEMTRLEDILHDNGYNQLYIEGSKGEFSMYDKYVGRRESSRLFDRKTASDQGYTDEGADYIWKWGIEDRKLFEITKELITDISKQDKPFFVTMYTMDTHTFESGHRCPICDGSIPHDYLASVDCCSRQTSEFVEWVRQQPFFENTTVILVGDHLGNEHTTEVDIGSDYVRTTYNCFINPAKEPAKTKDRLFSSLDMFPTTLSAIGAEIKGDRLGLGTDLFSRTPTLCEELGEEEYKAQLEMSSDYYSKEFFR